MFATNFGRNCLKNVHNFQQMELSQLEEEAKKGAMAQVAAMLKRPDQLDKLPQFRKRAERKKAAVEAMLKTAVQSQLEGVKTAIGQLKGTAQDVATAAENLEEVRSLLVEFPSRQERLSRLREENFRHGQFESAIQNLKQIANVREVIEKTRHFIQEGKLLHAHKHLSDLEKARDDMLHDVYRQQQQNNNGQQNQKAVKMYFSELDELAEELSKQMWFIMGRALEAVRGADPGPQRLVSVVRIVEREHRIDHQLMRQSEGEVEGFVAPGRPRRWRAKCFEVLENTVRQRIEGNQLEDRSDNKQWLARYLEVCRRIMLDDLRAAQLLSDVFPPYEEEEEENGEQQLDIYTRYVLMYHRAIADRLREVASEKLEKNELIQLLNWVHRYGEETMLGRRDLHVNVEAIVSDMPLLAKSTVAELYSSFVEMTRDDVTDWLEKALQKEKDDWYYNKNRPEEDAIGCFYTSLPDIIFKIILDQMSLAKEISNDIVPRTLIATVDAQLALVDRYREAFRAYKTKHFEDRSRFELFTHTMIAVANNCDICVESTERIKTHVRLTVDIEEAEGEEAGSPGSQLQRGELLSKIDTLKEMWLNSGHEAGFCFLNHL